MKTLSDWLEEEPFALALSSGFFGFFAHAGMVAALRSSNLLPSRLCGSSAGGLVAAFYAAGLDDTSIKELLLSVSREDFWDPTFGPGLLKGDAFGSILRDALPVRHMEDTKLPLSLSIFDVRTRSTLVVRTGNLEAAVRATCAVPGLFHPVRVHGRLSLDGGILDRHGIDALHNSPLRILHHHLPSSSKRFRKKGDLQVLPPVRKNLVSIQVPNLPRLNPFRLEGGKDAYDRAFDVTSQLLESRAPTNA